MTSGLYYKHITIVNYDSSVVTKFGVHLLTMLRVVLYDYHMFTLQANDSNFLVLGGQP